MKSQKSSKRETAKKDWATKVKRHWFLLFPVLFLLFTAPMLASF